MKKISYILLFLGCTFFPGCDKYLDIKPKGVVIPSTVGDYKGLLSDAISVTRTSCSQLYVTDEIVLPEANRTDVMYVGKDAIKAYDFDPEIFELDEADNDWVIAYKLIYICNSVIQGVDQAKEEPGFSRNEVKGEAFVHRAFTYLQLVNEYAMHYNAATASTDLGVPLPLKPDINALLPRATVKEVYEVIEKDLLSAIDLLPEKAIYSYRPSKAAAYGTLARVYLYKGDFEKANLYAGKALGVSSFLYDYNTLKWVNPTDKSKGIVDFPSTSIAFKDIVFQKYFHKVSHFAFTFYMSPELASLYNTGDLRFEFGTISKDWYGNTIKGIGLEYAKGFLANYNYAGIQTSELYLIRAETYARLKKPAEAMADLNTLRVKRIAAANFTPLTATNADDALSLVLNERRIELAFKGLRLTDIKRLNLEGRNISITHGSKTLLPGDPRFVLPIANSIITRNPNIIQNPR